MKALNKIFRILSIVFAAGSLVLYMFPFAEVFTNGITVKPVGLQLAFGANVTVDGVAKNLAMSGHILFVLLFVVISLLMSIFAYKAKGLRYSSSIFGLIAAGYAWVVALGKQGRFFDLRPLKNITKLANTEFLLFLAIALTVFAACAIAYLLIDDYLEAKANGKKTIGQRIVQFFRDNKSEVKKIVWPGWNDVIKNTITVLVMCLVIGVLIWGIDLGLGKLIDWILK